MSFNDVLVLFLSFYANLIRRELIDYVALLTLPMSFPNKREISYGRLSN